MPSSRPMDGMRSMPKEKGMSSATPMVAVMPGIAPSRTPPSAPMKVIRRTSGLDQTVA